MPWSDNPNAPQLPHVLYLLEKGHFAGNVLSAILFGICTVLFFQCVGALLNQVNRTRRMIKLGLVAHAVAMFSIIAISVAMKLSQQSLSYIEYRRFPGDGVAPPGPFGYQNVDDPSPLQNFSKVAFPLNQWLADGFLLYRCYVIYSRKNWVVAFPCLVYIASIATGVAFVYEASKPDHGEFTSTAAELAFSYFIISVPLNVLLTLMIVIRLVLCGRNIRRAAGATVGAIKGYKAIVTILVESSALYTVALLLYIGTNTSEIYIRWVFSHIAGWAQVIAPFLITLRVANRRALMVSSGNLGSIRFRSQGRSTNDIGTLPDGNTVSSMETNGGAPDGLGVGTETAIEEIPR